MSTDQFEQGLNELIELTFQKTTVIMCAEAVPWRCHHFLIADALVVKGFTVEHIMSRTIVNAYKLSTMAVLQKGKLIYPGGD